MATTYRIPKLSSRREFFRLPYPVTTGATLAVDGANYTVEEVSERGLRLSSAKGAFAVDTAVQGTLVLTAGVRCAVTGTVLRVEEKCVVAQTLARPHQLRRHPRATPRRQDSSPTGSPSPPETSLPVVAADPIYELPSLGSADSDRRIPLTPRRSTAPLRRGAPSPRSQSGPSSANRGKFRSPP